MIIDEFNGDNFDHGRLASSARLFGQVQTTVAHRDHRVPPGNRLGSKWKQALKDNYLSTINSGGAATRRCTAIVTII